MASWKCCPHVDASLRSRGDLECREAFFLYHGTNRTPEDDPTPLEKVQPWIDMLRELLLESQLPGRVVNKFMGICVPSKHHHAIKPVVGDAAAAILADFAGENPPTFHRFPDLPAELRITIWELAAAQPRRILPWGGYSIYGKLPLNVPKHMPRVAQTCKEAWDAVGAMGGYCEPHHHEAYNLVLAEKTPPKGVWASHDDLVYIPDGLRYEPRLFNVDRAWGLDFLCARKELAVEYNEFVQLGPSKRVYRFLRHARKLKTLVFVMVARDISIYVDLENRESESDFPSEQFENREMLHKLVMHEDTLEMEKLDALWQGLGPEAIWIWRRIDELCRVNAAVYAPWMVARCMPCETRLWNDEYVPRIKSAWLRIMCAEEPEIRNDADIFPDGFEPNWEHPWVQKALSNMPELKPAVLLNFRRGSPAEDASPAMWSKIVRWAEHPEEIP